MAVRLEQVAESVAAGTPSVLEEDDCEPPESLVCGLLTDWASSDFVELAMFKMSRRRTEKRKRSGMSLLHPCLRSALVSQLYRRS